MMGTVMRRLMPLYSNIQLSSDQSYATIPPKGKRNQAGNLISKQLSLFDVAESRIMEAIV